MKTLITMIFLAFCFLIQPAAFAQDDTTKHDMKPIDVTPAWLNVAPIDVVVDGGCLYAIGHTGLYIYNISDPVKPVWVNTVEDVIGSSICVSGGYVHVSNSWRGYYIVDVDPPEDAHIVKTINPSLELLDIAIAGDYLYVMSYDHEERKYGIKVVSINPPEQAQIISSIELPYVGANLVIDNGYIYTANRYYGLQVVDISNPEAPRFVKLFKTGRESESIRYGGYERNGVTLDVSDGCAYLCCGKSGLQVIDIDPIRNMHVKETIKMPDDKTSVAFVSVSEGFAYVSSGYEGGLKIIDVSSPSDVCLIDSTDIERTYNVCISDGFAYVASGKYGLSIVNIDPPQLAYVAGGIKTLAGSIAVEVSDGYAYVLCNENKLNIVDIDPLESAQITGIFNLPKSCNGIAVSDDYAFVTSRNYGTYIVDISHPESPKLVKNLKFLKSIEDFIISSDYAYICTGSNLCILDIAPPVLTFVLKEIKCRSGGVLTIRGEKAYILDFYEADIIDISNPREANLIETISFKGNTEETAIADGITYIPGGYENQMVITIDPEKPIHMNKSKSSLHVTYVLDNIAFCWDYSELTIVKKEGIYIKDYESLGESYLNSLILYQSDLPSMIEDAFYSSSYLYLSGTPKGLRFLNLFPQGELAPLPTEGR